MHTITEAIREGLKKETNPEDAVQKQRYMKTDQKFYGVRTPVIRHMVKDTLKEYGNLSRDDYSVVISELWSGIYREEMYSAIFIAESVTKYIDKTSLPIYEEMIYTSTNWDLLDGIASHLISPLILKHRELEKELERWSRSTHLWTRRASILAFLHHKEQANLPLLEKLILSLAADKEFFIRKAIGWILRDMSYKHPEWVRNFIDTHENELSPLSKKEGMKALNRMESRKNESS